VLRRSLLTSAGLGLAASGIGSAASAIPVGPSQEGHPIVIGRGYDLVSKVLGQTRRINVWLPPSYADGKQTYPVLYLQDGGEPEDFHHISGLLQVGIMDGYLRDVILVGVADIDRRHDLTFPTHDARDLKDFPTTGGSAAFRAFFAEELLPWTAARYRLNGERGVIGESLAGLFIVETLLRQPDLFDTYIAVSPSLWWDNQSLARGASALLAAADPAVLKTRRLWLTIGNEGSEMLAAVEMLAQAVRPVTGAGGFTYHPLPDEHHNTIFHPAAGLALRQLYPAPPPPKAA
jgi:predicted alpha/beta superfamily hydrolase